MKRLLASLCLVLGLATTAMPQQLHVISDQNFKQYLKPGGYGFDKNLKPKSGLITKKFAEAMTDIPRSQWAQLVQQGKGTFLSDMLKAYAVPVKNQDGLGYCWVYASVGATECGRCMQGQPYVELSPESVGGPLTGWRNEGGNGLDAMNQLMKVGACSASFMNAPNSLSVRRWQSGWQDDCAKHKVALSIASIDTFDDVFTAVLMRCPVSIGLDWWGHQVLVTDPYIFSDGSFGVVFRNSWGNDWPNAGAGGWSTLTEAKAQPDGSFAVIGVGVYDFISKEKLTPAQRVLKSQERMRALIQKAKPKLSEIECPCAEHPNTAIVTCPVPPACPHHSWPLTDAEKKSMTKEQIEAIRVPQADVYDYTSKPGDGSQPVSKHLLKSISPCGCVVKVEVCKCIPNGSYPGVCNAATDGKSSECIYSIKVDPKDCLKVQ